MSKPDYENRYAGLTPGDIKLALASERYGEPVTDKVLVPLTPEEETEMRARYAQNGIDRTRIELTKKEAMARFKEQIDPIKDEEAEQLRTLERGAVLRRETIYEIDDQENNLMLRYTESGRFIDMRPLTRVERIKQLRAID